ncbi:TrmB family transcriptional regulator [Paracoccus sp. Z118]|uniref:TrmB family transcriptional regulator n=1 Tax=Paracoccus sp. Z118 TaxID=2851017 RepID=UPI001C2BEBEC|nr:TrmB family transcriptional regulator [Paracoccus sp. Z118]MBV0893237.1 TrmB family transcriptional regulator [Paracoccus sp. Z118]
MVGKLALKDGGIPDDLVSDLRRLGFTDYEARIYIELLRQGEPETAYELSKRTGVPRPNAYNALESLAQKGAVLAVSETPVRYAAAPAKDLLGSIARQTSAICDDVSARLSKLTVTEDDQLVWSLTGERTVHEKIDRLIENAHEILMIKAPDDILARHIESLTAAGKRGLEMLIVVFGPDAERFTFGPRCRTFIHEGNGVRMGSTDNLFTVAADHEEMVTARFSGEAQAVHTRNKPIVNMAESLIRHDYYMAEIFQRFGAEIDEAFGPYLRDLRLACFTPEQAESFRLKTGL